MSAPLLALWIADAPDPAARAEALRVLVAARAANRPVRLLDLRWLTRAVYDPPPEPPPLTDSLPEQDAVLLEALALDGVPIERADAKALSAALTSCDSVLVLASPSRARRPALLLVTAAWLRSQSGAALLPALASAGTIVRA